MRVAAAPALRSFRGAKGLSGLLCGLCAFGLGALPALPAAAQEGKEAAPEKARGRSAGPLNPQVAAMPDNSWLKLRTPTPHSIVRSGSPWMPYAPEAKVAFVWGAVHGGSSNDLWTYDMAANAWKELHKAEAHAAQDPGVLKLKDAVLMTREERPLAGHQWGAMDYDSDGHALWLYTDAGCSWQGLYTGGSHLHIDSLKVRLSFTGKEYEEALSKRAVKGPTLWKYDLKTNKWSWVHSDDSARVAGYASTFRYFPPLGKFVVVPMYKDDQNTLKLFDPKSRKWEGRKLTRKVDPSDYISSNSPIVYDSRRKVMVISNTQPGGTFILDPVQGTLEKIVPAAKTPFVNLDGNCGILVYDSVNATTLTVYTKSNFKVYDTGKHFEKLGLPCDDTYVWALDIDKKEWCLQPPPTGGVKPGERGATMSHAYYDPAQNAVLVYEGSYGGGDGDTWVYRYKAARRGR